MLFQATLGVDLIAMAVCLWMAFYLLARGYPGKIILRGTVILLSLSAFFYGAYNNLFEQISGTAAWRAVFLIVGIGTWYDITLQLLPEPIRKKQLAVTTGVYTLGLVAILSLIFTQNAFIGEQGNVLYVARMQVSFPYILYGLFEMAAFIGILYNLLAHNKIGLTSAGRYFLFASICAAADGLYGVISLALAPPMPRIIQDVLIFGGVFMIGISVALHQSLIERRTTLQDFPLTTAAVALIALAYTQAALRLGLPLRWVGTLVAFVVLTHSTYDLIREFLDRKRTQEENTLRKKLRDLENKIPSQDALQQHLQEGLDLLCSTLDARSAFIAVRREEEFWVTASRRSVEVERRFPASALSYEDVSNVQNDLFPEIIWFAPSFAGQTQIAVVGISHPANKLEYSRGDLDLLSEIADKMGTIVSLSDLQSQQNIVQTGLDEEANTVANEMLNALELTPDEDFIRMVEDGLRRMSDYIVLGQSPLADKLGVKAGSHIERGKELQKILHEAIELLRPAEKRPPEPLPRVWYNHAVLHDAYVEGVPNREIMARLYISEGTFNRTRRSAIRGLARLLMEKQPTSK
ncbi:MAG: hypothetical protein U0X74_11495 [Anaerolineales bacterium]